MNSPVVLTDKNFLELCAKNYFNPTCASSEEFYEDIRRIKYIKKLLTKFTETGDLKERLVLNHIIVLGNVFNPIFLNRVLFLKAESQFYQIKPFLLTLGILSEKIENVREFGSVSTDLIVMDPKVINKIRDILPNKRLDL